MKPFYGINLLITLFLFLTAQVNGQQKVTSPNMNNKMRN